LNPKGLTNLKGIWLFSNKLSALHPRIFSHLNNLNHLDLRHNVCINRIFGNKPSKALIEEELATCGTGYALYEKQNLKKRRVEEMEKKFVLV
jgi:hypothetical protein